LNNIIIPELDIDASEVYDVINSIIGPDGDEDNYMGQIEYGNNYEYDIESIFER